MIVTVDYASRDTGTSQVPEALSQKLADPQVAASLGVLLEHADLLAILVQGLDEFVRRGDSVTGAIAEIVGEAKQSVLGHDNAKKLGEVDLGALAESLMTVSRLLPTVTPVLTQAVESGAIATFLDSEIVSQPVIRQLSMVANSAVAAAHQTTSGQQRPLTMTGTLKALRDDDVQRGLGFAIAALRNIGKSLAPGADGYESSASPAQTNDQR